MYKRGGEVIAQQVTDELPKLSGFYFGGGFNVNHDEADIKTREEAVSFQVKGLSETETELVRTHLGISGVRAAVFEATVPSGTKIGSAKDVSYGVHAVIGYGHLFPNKLFLAIEQEVGYAHHPCEIKWDNTYHRDKSKNKLVESLELTSLVRLGFALNSVHGIPYLSGGIKVFKIDGDDNKTVVRPVIGLGYQHALSYHWSMRGDIMYTHVSTVNYLGGYNNKLKLKANGHRISGAVTFLYTF